MYGLFPTGKSGPSTYLSREPSLAALAKSFHTSRVKVSNVFERFVAFKKPLLLKVTAPEDVCSQAVIIELLVLKDRNKNPFTVILKNNIKELN